MRNVLSCLFRSNIIYTFVSAPTTAPIPGTLAPPAMNGTTAGVPNYFTTATATGVPSTICNTVARWSSWVNRDKPTVGDGDKEVRNIFFALYVIVKVL